MARPKKTVKAKEPVRIRFKELNNGNKSIYLDIYRDGKRTYEFLKLYLVPETTPVARTQNEAALLQANQIKSQRIIELGNTQAGITIDPKKGKLLLSEWLQIYYEMQQKKGRRSLAQLKGQINIINSYNPRAVMKDLDTAFSLGFIDYVRSGYVVRSRSKKAKEQPDAQPRHLAPKTAQDVEITLKCALKAAIQAGIIDRHPFAGISKADEIKVPESKRTFLTIDEVKALIATPCKREDVKNAFLFSCFCGLRWSDTSALTWGNIEQENGKYHIALVMKKTREPLYLPLNKQALSYLPVRGLAASTDVVFKTLPELAYVNKHLKTWAAAAGITKNVSFHISRHTFATTSLTLGADLYTTSKLLGHASIQTTQIYAKIVNSKKDEAVALFDTAF